MMRFKGKLPVVLMCLGQSLAVQGVFAQNAADTRPISYGASLGLSYDSNYARAASNLAQSATSLDSRLNIGYNDQISRQRIAANAELGYLKFFNQTANSAGIYRLNGRWDWEYGPVWFGQVDASVSRSINTGSEQLFSVRNLVDNRGLGLDLGYRLDVRWAVIASLGYSDLSNSALALQGADTATSTGALAIRYQPGTAWEARVGIQQSHVNRADQRFNAFGQPLLASIDNDSVDRRLFMAGSWTPNDTSKFLGNLAYARRSYDQSAGRNFSGLAWSFGYYYSPFRTWSANLQFSRDITNQNYAFSSHTEANTLALSGKWQATGKIAVSPIASVTYRKFSGDANGGSAGLGSTTTIRYGARADYELFPSVNMFANLFLERRNGSGSVWSYNNTSLNVGGVFKY